MPRDISQARINLTKISSMLKQGNLMSAAQALRNALHVYSTKTLMRKESEELSKLIMQNGPYLENSKEIRKIFPLSLQYTAGQEQELIETLDELIRLLEDETTESAKAQLKALEEAKKAGLTKGKEELNKGQTEEAKKTFSKLHHDFPTDPNLISDIAQAFMDSGIFEEASDYFQSSIKLAPENIFALNRLAVTLRRLGKFERSEIHFQTAIELDPDDPNLYFNMGRLYLDWKKWDEGMKNAQKACDLLPDFKEAKQMLAYFENKKSNG